MATVPGSAGLPVIGDSSYEFYKDPVKHYQKRKEQNRSRVFLSRFLNKPTIFIGSNAVLHELFTGTVKPVLETTFMKRPPALTLSQTIPGFYMSTAQVF